MILRGVGLRPQFAYVNNLNIRDCEFINTGIRLDNVNEFNINNVTTRVCGISLYSCSEGFFTNIFNYRVNEAIDYFNYQSVVIVKDNISV